MAASIQYTSSTEVRVGDYKEVASVDFYIATTNGIQIYQKYEQFHNSTIFHIKVLNTSTLKLLNLKLTDYIITSDPYSIQYIRTSKGCYHPIPHGVYFYIPSMEPDEVIYLRLVLSTKPDSYVSNSIGLKN